MVRVVLDGVQKRFGDVVAVDRVDLEMHDASFTILLGPSGCGKTTTLNMIAGLEDVSGGRILFDDEEVHHLPAHRRDVAMVFQSYALYPNRSVRENIAFGLKLRHMPKGDIARRVEEVAQKLDITALLNRYPRALSGGQQQRVALARAIVRRPKVFLFDEPLSNLDAKLRADMRIELKALQRDVNGTFVYVTHDQAEAMSLADKIVVMNKGRVLQVAPPLRLYREPADLFVAAFVGSPSMNLIAGEIAGDGVFRTDGWSCPMPPGVPHGRAVLGVRSEDVILEPAESGDGHIRFVEYLGAESLLAVRMPFGDIIARGPAEPSLRTDDHVRVRAGRTHLFDPSSGQRLRPSSGDVSELVKEAQRQ